MKNILFHLLFIVILLIPSIASDRTDAADLLKKCETEYLDLEICIKNFGNAEEIKLLENGADQIKLGRLKYTQSDYPAAKAQFEAYQKLQYELYGLLAAKYYQRCLQLNDDIGFDLADYIDNPEVVKYFKLAADRIAVSKSALGQKKYTQVINGCRAANLYLLGLYELLKKPLPNGFKKDLADCNKKVFN